MVEAALRALAVPRRLVRISGRAQLSWISVTADVVAAVCAYMAAVAVRGFSMTAIGLRAVPFAPDWSVAVLIAVTVSVFYAAGLYDMEVYVSRPLHLWTLLRASLTAFAISALIVYVATLNAFAEPRLVFLTTLVGFLLFACVLRLGVLDALYANWVTQRRTRSFLLGDSQTAQAIGDRLAGLRGFNRVERIAAAERHLDMAEALRTALAGGPSPRKGGYAVFIDATSGTPREVFGAAAVAREFGLDAYVVSPLLGSLEDNRLLSTLFGVPVVRVRRSIEDAKPYPLKRVFDVVGSAALLLVFVPLVAVLGLVIRLTSPGPVFYKQTRVGRFGVPFAFLKLRSMVINRDASFHRDYVRAFMNGTAEAVATGPGGEAVFKRVDDPRITPVGRFIRKYSLDEIPQFWNVFRGDMSLVGPRPPLPYEVSEYDDWHSLRLAAPAGVTGLWQAEGRSRVSFDEMILQDVMYTQSMRFLLDVKLCLKTIPAMLLGGGGG